MKPKKKPCKGINKAKHFTGCGKEVYQRTYGLCQSCYANWLLTTPEGQDKIKRSTIKAKKQNENQQKKQWENKKRKMSVTAHAKTHKKDLQANINKLCRMIDERFGYKTCICCHLKLDKRVNACHYHSTGSDATLTYNLHNLHSGTMHCNFYKATHHKDYAQGIILRYGNAYFEYIEYTLKQHPLINLTAQEIYDKKLLTNKLIREFDTYQFMDAIHARDQINLIIGIYKPRK